ncbi:hypothetical protein, partial [Roseibacillus ishigakijimensis]|uniref:hypothetical protein n=1 Tax=Roseibacillus ishigakijimensis TaxID=454146 RepID=UPI001F2EF5BC
GGGVSSSPKLFFDKLKIDAFRIGQCGEGGVNHQNDLRPDRSGNREKKETVPEFPVMGRASLFFRFLGPVPPLHQGESSHSKKRLAVNFSKGTSFRFRGLGFQAKPPASVKRGRRFLG